MPKNDKNSKTKKPGNLNMKKVALILPLTIIGIIAGFAIYHTQEHDTNLDEDAPPVSRNEDEQQNNGASSSDDSKEVERQDANNDSRNTTISPKPAPSKNENAANTSQQNTAQPQETTPAKPDTGEVVIEEKPAQEQSQVVECAYKRLYGNKTPEEVAGSSAMVEFYYKQYQDATKEYEATKKLYANSTTPEFLYKIEQTEFAKEKAYALYKRELDARTAEYSAMYAECK